MLSPEEIRNHQNQRKMNIVRHFVGSDVQNIQPAVDAAQKQPPTPPPSKEKPDNG